MTRYGHTTARSLWGTPVILLLMMSVLQKKYAAGGRSRFNLTDYDYLFGQASWLTDRYNGYRERDVLTAGYGRQFFEWPGTQFPL